MPAAAAGAVRRLLPDVAVGLLAVMLSGLALATVVLSVQLSPVLTSSMTGTFDAGALLLSRPVPTSEVRAADVIVFTAPGTADRYAHRVVSVEPGPAGTVVTTRGDANPAPDPWRAQLQDSHVPRVVTSVPHLGRLVVATSDPGPRAALLALAGLLFGITGTRVLLGPAAVRHPRPRTG